MSQELTTKNNLPYCIKQLKSRAMDYCYDDYYDFAHIDLDILIIENLMCNGRCHLVAVFKNYLIEDDKSEYLRRFYKKKESTPRLKKLFAYHDETSVIFPNYVPLAESKYLYNNVIKKQRVIDEQQSLEKVRKDNKGRRHSSIKKEERMFNSTIVGEILTSNKSVIRIMFGLDETEKNNNDKSKSNADSDCEDFDKLINEIEKAEENADNIKDNSLEGFNLTNKASKYKLKLGNKFNINIPSKNKNNDKLYNITNNSTNITSTSNINNINNNINNNTNLKQYKKNTNLILKDNSLQTHSNLKIGKKQKNMSLNKTNPNKKYTEDINSNKSRNHHSSINSKTLYGLNFHTNNKIIQNLINKEKKINLKSKSNNSHNHNQYLDKIKPNIFSNNYIYNNNFPQNLKINERNINFYTERNNKLNLIVKSYNDKAGTSQIPKIDMNKIKMVNNNFQENKYNSNSNRNNNRNNNYILNNPNLFFTETDVLKSERNTMKKRNLKKGNLKTKVGPILTFSPLKLSSKILVGKNSNNNNKNMAINEKIFKSMNHRNTKVNQYLPTNSNQNNIQRQTSYKNKKSLVINEYNYKIAPKINPGQNYFNRFYKK